MCNRELEIPYMSLSWSVYTYITVKWTLKCTISIIFFWGGDRGASSPPPPSNKGRRSGSTQSIRIQEFSLSFKFFLVEKHKEILVFNSALK